MNAAHEDAPMLPIRLVAPGAQLVVVGYDVSAERAVVVGVPPEGHFVFPAAAVLRVAPVLATTDLAATVAITVVPVAAVSGRTRFRRKLANLCLGTGGRLAVAADDANDRAQVGVDGRVDRAARRHDDDGLSQDHLMLILEPHRVGALRQSQ